MTTAPARRATLCITTFHRPAGLERALVAVEAMRVPPGWRLDVVVVDNDEDQSARPVVERAAAGGLPVRYVVEPRRGIPQARNRCVAEATGDWVIFLDDDEAPRPDWFEVVDAVQGTTDADVVVGASVARFDRPPPAWIERGRFFERQGDFPARWRGEGLDIPYWIARTSGVLIRRSSIDALGGSPFEEALALTGGEDRTFFERIAASGGRIVWAGDAVVEEAVPASRTTARWLLRRSFRIGAARSTAMMLTDRSAGRRAKRIGRAALDTARGLAGAVVARGTENRVRSLLRAATGVGLAFGTTGRRFDEYRTTHGS